MRVASTWFALGVFVVATGIARAGDEKEALAKKAERSYAVTCRVAAQISTEDMKAKNVQPLAFTAPRIIVSNGGTASVCDKSEKSLSFGDGLTTWGARAAIERKATEGMTIEATVIAQDDRHVVVDVTIELTSVDSTEKQANPVRVDFFKGRWIERVELGKTVTFANRDAHLEVTVNAIEEAGQGTADARRAGANANIAYVRYIGTRLKSRHLAKQTGFRAGQPLNVAKVKEGRDKLVAYYRDKGYRNASIEIAEGTGEGDEGVTYKIEDGERESQP